MSWVSRLATKADVKLRILQITPRDSRVFLKCCLSANPLLCLFSALTVRYLTRRYIGEYRSDTGKFLPYFRKTGSKTGLVLMIMNLTLSLEVLKLKLNYPMSETLYFHTLFKKLLVATDVKLKSTPWVASKCFLVRAMHSSTRIGCRVWCWMAGSQESVSSSAWMVNVARS